MQLLIQCPTYIFPPNFGSDRTFFFFFFNSVLQTSNKRSLLLESHSRKESDHRTYSNDVRETSAFFTFLVHIACFFHAYLNCLSGNPRFPTSYLSSFTTSPRAIPCQQQRALNLCDKPLHRFQLFLFGFI